jgi:predicted phosphoribosyltransferase
MRLPFEDRREAGRILARALLDERRQVELVLALPRGGVPVGYEIANALSVPLDVFVVRKLGTPGHEELAMGAIAAGGTRVMNDEVLSMLRVPESAVEAEAQRELVELERRERAYRDGHEPEPMQGKHTLLVDDGLATGASMRAAVSALRQLDPASITVAVPVAARETCEEIEMEVDALVCMATPDPFVAVGMWYRNFRATTDDEVRDLLRTARARTGAEMESRQR